MRLTRGRTVAFSLVVLALAIIWRVASPRALDVDIAVVSRGPLEITIDEEARTEIRHHAEVAAPVSGRVSNSTVVAGDVVTRGDIVARLAPAPLDPRARAEAEAALRESTSLLHEASARVAQARLALDDARKDRARTERLSATGAVAPRDLEAAVTAVRQREREVDAATARQAAATQEEQRARAALMPTDPAKTRAGTMTLEVRSAAESSACSKSMIALLLLARPSLKSAIRVRSRSSFRCSHATPCP
ncbi:MAG: biotin/lipoyl-binding protein [Gemmatimonadaceae bacterium]